MRTWETSEKVGASICLESLESFGKVWRISGGNNNERCAIDQPRMGGYLMLPQIEGMNDCMIYSPPGVNQSFIVTLFYKMKRIADAVLRWAFFSLNLSMLALFITQN